MTDESQPVQQDEPVVITPAEEPKDELTHKPYAAESDAHNETAQGASEEPAPEAAGDREDEDASESDRRSAEDVQTAPSTLPRSDDDAAVEGRKDASDEDLGLTGQGPKTSTIVREYDGTNRRNGDDGLLGCFVKVARGDHAGRVGVYQETLEHDRSGLPKLILVRTRDEFNELLTVLHKDVVSTSYAGGR